MGFVVLAFCDSVDLGRVISTCGAGYLGKKIQSEGKGDVFTFRFDERWSFRFWRFWMPCYGCELLMVLSRL